MSEAGPESGNEIRIGVLIIGSLFWDSSQRRKDWRRDRLDMDAARRVHAPIRYGRRSTGRGRSYTMVFSRELLAEERFGRALVVPCSRTVNDAAGIVEEAVRLWTAETRDGNNRERRISAEAVGGNSPWGCVALLEHRERPLSDEVRKAWEDRVREEGHDYGRLNSAVDEEPAVARTSGLLNIPWPTPVNGSDLPCDILLATATDPTLVEGRRYPTAQEIADARNTPEGKQHIDYFCKNRANGIKTDLDGKIEDRLRELWQ